jgi:hypothetical protein
MSPYFKPRKIDEIIEYVNNYIIERANYKDYTYASLWVDEDKVYDFIETMLMNCQAFKELNLSQYEIDNGIGLDDDRKTFEFVGMNISIKQEYDFVDLDACIRNIVKDIEWHFLDEDLYDNRKEIVVKKDYIVISLINYRIKHQNN